MTPRTFYVTAIAAVALCVLVSPASATHVQCGDTITTTTTLDSDVVCADPVQVGLYIGADNVILKMNGFKIQGVGASYVGISGSDNLQNIEIKRGAIEGFSVGGIRLDADDSAVVKVSVRTDNVRFDGFSVAGVALTGDRNAIYQSSVTLAGNGEDGQLGIALHGDDAYAWGNAVTTAFTTPGAVTLLSASGERPRTVYNQVTNCPAGPSGTGILVSGYTEYAVVNRNTVTGCQADIFAVAAGEAGGRARVALNDTTGGGVGIAVNDATATVNRNVVRNASALGIQIYSGGTHVRRNQAYDNGNYGIFAADGVVDGGGNIASGNGDGTQPQCVNVQCSSP